MLTINITKWGTKKTVVYNTLQRPEIIGRESRQICGLSVGDPLCGVINLLMQIIPRGDKFV